MDTYSSFAELADREKLGTDYEIVIVPCRRAQVVVIAPHGGCIEPETSCIAQQIASAGFSYYSFTGLKHTGNRILHVTSHNFDEPECVSLVAQHDYVVAIHGCSESGERLFIGGLDTLLILALAAAISRCNLDVVVDNHPYLGRHPSNICNRGRRGVGVQFELTLPFRRSQSVPAFVEAVQQVLSSRLHAA